MTAKTLRRGINADIRIAWPLCGSLKENIEIVETYHAGAALPPTKLRKY